MDAIKRYSFYVGAAGNTPHQTLAVKSNEDSLGAWVKYEDHLAALKAAGESVAWISSETLRLMLTKQIKGCSVFDMDFGDCVQLYTRPLPPSTTPTEENSPSNDELAGSPNEILMNYAWIDKPATPTEGEMLEWVLANGLPERRSSGKYWYPGVVGDFFDTQRAAILAAMAAEGRS